jgi:hypothetical protein
MREVIAWLEHGRDIPICRVRYRKVLSDPTGSAKAVGDFLDIQLNMEAMALEMDPSLYRNRLS